MQRFGFRHDQPLLQDGPRDRINRLARGPMADAGGEAPPSSIWRRNEPCRDHVGHQRVLIALFSRG